jgi:hypothetical protein
MAGRMPALNSDVSRKIWPSVIEITLVGTNADTSPGLRLDDRQRGQRTGLALDLALGEGFDIVGVDTGSALEQAAVEIEHVAG